MSNVEARLVPTLSPSGGEPFESHRTARGGAHAAEGKRRRWLVSAGYVAGDVLSGTMAIAVAAAIIAIAEPAGHAGHAGLAGRLQMQMPVMLLLLVGISCSLGLYRPSVKSLMERFRLRATAAILFVFAGTLIWVRDGLSIELAIVPLVGAIALLFGSWAEHLIGARLARSGLWRAPAAILGSGATSRAVARLLLSHPACGLRPVGFIDDGKSDGDNVHTLVTGQGADESNALPVLGTLEGWQADGGVDVVIVPDSKALPDNPTDLYRLGVRQILVVNRLGEFPSFGLQVRSFDHFVALELGGRSRDPSQGLKRAMDIAVALPLALLVAPIVGVLALAIKIADPGSAFYGQRRIGRYGKPIQVLKLRTMYRDAEQRLDRVLASDPALREQWQRYFKLPDDPRILPGIGNFMRRTSLDELPQLWNVLRGDMSLVGPRPFPAYHLEAFDPEFRALRMTVPPGLTGLWQISSRSNGGLDVQREQDSFYIHNRSLSLDLYILIATLPAVIGAEGAR